MIAGNEGRIHAAHVRGAFAGASQETAFRVVTDSTLNTRRSMEQGHFIVELKVEVDAGGVVRNVRANGSPPAEPRARSVYEAARRALLDPKCNPLPLPRERLAALRDTVFRFNPRDLGLR